MPEIIQGIHIQIYYKTSETHRFASSTEAGTAVAIWHISAIPSKDLAKTSLSSEVKSSIVLTWNPSTENLEDEVRATEQGVLLPSSWEWSPKHIPLCKTLARNSSQAQVQGLPHPLMQQHANWFLTQPFITSWHLTKLPSDLHFPVHFPSLSVLNNCVQTWVALINHISILLRLLFSSNQSSCYLPQVRFWQPRTHKSSEEDTCLGLDSVRAQLCKAQSTQNLDQFFRSPSPHHCSQWDTSGHLCQIPQRFWAPLKAWIPVLEHKRCRSTSCYRESFSQPFEISFASSSPLLV